jgi:hypothetical protein
MAPRHLSIANRELSANLEAALALGSVEYLGGDIAWVLGLMDSRGMPSDLLPDYLGAYQRAAGKHLDERGAPILEWLARVSEPAGQAGAA